MSGISKSQVSRLCAEIDERVGAFLERPIEGRWPYLWLDATYLKVRRAGHIVPVAATVAVAVNTEGRRDMVAAAIRTAFVQEDHAAASTQWRQVAGSLHPRFETLARLMDEAEPDVLAFMTFPRDHSTKIHSSNPIESTFATVRHIRHRATPYRAIQGMPLQQDGARHGLQTRPVGTEQLAPPRRTQPVAQADRRRKVHRRNRSRQATTSSRRLTQTVTKIRL